MAKRAKKKTKKAHLEAGEAARAFSEADFARARRALMRRDPKLAAVIKRVGRCELAEGRTHDPFASLVRVIMGQQLSGKAADTIHGRLVALVKESGGVTPKSIRALEATAMRGAGVSSQKIRYLYDLADHVSDGRLDLHSLDGHPDEEVIAKITAVKGLGRWSAEMFLMFRLNRPDILPVGDLGIVKGMQRLFDMKRRPSAKTMTRLAEPWRPYRSIASWYVWRA